MVISEFAKKSHRAVQVKKQIPKILWSIFRFVLFIGLAFIILQPLIIKFSSSFKGIIDMYDSSVFLFPKHPTVYNYERVFDYYNYPLRFLNSVLLCVIVGILQATSCTLTAYGLARFRYRGCNLVFGMAIFSMIIPTQTVLLPLFLQFEYFSPITFFTLGFQLEGISLIGTPIPLILLSLTASGFKNGLYIFMLRQYFKNLPTALEEAAYIDGCNRLTTFLRIMLPGAVPMIVTIFLFAFVWQWNDYFYSMILMPGMNIFTTVFSRVGEAITRGDGALFDSMQIMLYDSAAMVLHIIPLIVLYAFTQKFFVQSIERSGLVG